jgi:hypothetical protein
MTGQIAPGANGYAVTGRVETSSLDRNARLPRHTGANVASTDQRGRPATIPVDATGLPAGPFRISSPRLAPTPRVNAETSDTGALRTDSVGAAPGSFGRFGQTVQPAGAPPSLGVDRPVQTMVGYIGGLERAVSGRRGSDLYIVSNSGGAQSSVQISTYANGQLSGVFQDQAYVRTEGGALAPITTNTKTLRFGGDESADYRPGNSGYIDSRVFGARAQQRQNGAPTSEYQVQGEGGSVSAPFARDGSFMVSSGAVNVAATFPGVNFCVCDYTRWGFWSEDTSFSARRSSGFSSHISTWVAGLPSNVADMPTVGVATYSGHVIASMARNNSQYLAASNMSATVNFGAGSASAVVDNLDGYRYAGSASGIGRIPTNFQVLLAGTPVDRGQYTPTMALNGGFFRSASSPVGSIAGAAAITTPGQNYIGSGIFALQR